MNNCLTTFNLQPFETKNALQLVDKAINQRCYLLRNKTRVAPSVEMLQCIQTYRMYRTKFTTLSFARFMVQNSFIIRRIVPAREKNVINQIDNIINYSKFLLNGN